MGEPIFPTLQQRTLRMSALKAIRDNILNGTLRPGLQLVQADIAAQMNISRAPIREALRQLEQEGLVESVPYHGTFVSRVTRRDILELYSLRGALEGLAVRLIASRLDPRDLSSLEVTLGQMVAAAGVGDYFAINATDLEFHTRLCVLSRHGHLLRTWRMNSNLIRRVLSMRNQLSPPQVIVDRHRPVMEALRAGDAQAAQYAIEDHCINSGEALADQWPEEEANLGPEVYAHDAHPGD
jgi:DNA-binding GntR family transcriptional regulator